MTEVKTQLNTEIAKKHCFLAAAILLFIGKITISSGVSRGVLWVLKHPAHADPEKKKEEEKKKKKEKERKKEKEKGKEANDNEKYLSSSLPPLNGFKVSRHGPIRRTR